MSLKGVILRERDESPPSSLVLVGEEGGAACGYAEGTWDGFVAMSCALHTGHTIASPWAIYTRVWHVGQKAVVGTAPPRLRVGSVLNRMEGKSSVTQTGFKRQRLPLRAPINSA